MNRKTIVISVTVLVVFVLGLLMLAFPASSVSAQTPQPPAQSPQDKLGKGLVDRGLERAFKLEQRRLKEQDFLFKRMDQGVKRADQLIERLKTKGVDTKALEAALTEFKGKKAEAYASHEAAAAILKEHKGFDANGKVTDRVLARETLKSANVKLVEARKIGGEAFHKFMRILQEWLKSNKPAGTK